MASLVYYLQRNIGGSSTEGSVYRFNIIYFLGEAEVCDKGMAIFIKDDIFGF
jgi:hypothetical protein